MDIKLCYEAHRNNWQNKFIEKDERLYHIINKDCIGYQIIKRILDIINPFLMEKNKWLTIGDYNGLEANYLLNNRQEAIASDISDLFLKESKLQGLINDYSIVNVESIQYPDNAFDYLFCKESFHHFPRAYIGLYEMIRCSKKATIFIEPIDVITKMPLLLLMKNISDRFNPLFINKIWKNRFSFEIIGNYVFKISEREVEKIAMGLGLTCIAFKRINLILDLKTDNLIIRETPINVKHWKKILRKVKFKNILSNLNIIPYNHLCCVVFKSYPDAETKRQMKESGYIIIDLPENPYLKTMASTAS